MDARVGTDAPYLGEAEPTGKPPARGLGARIWRASRFFLMVVLPIAFLVGAVAGFSYLRATRPVVPVERQSERARPVLAVAAEPSAIQPDLSVFGRIVAGRSVDIRALVGGEVIAVSDALVEGGRIAAGEEILRVDPFASEGALVRARADLAEARARIAEIEARTRQELDAIARAEEQLVISERELSRLTQLRDTGAATLRALDDVQLRVSQAQAALETRRNQLAIFEAQGAQQSAALERLAFAVSQAERTLSETVLRAPFDAIVSNVGAEVGKLVNVNDRIATLVATQRLEARFSLSDAQYARIAAQGDLVGRPVTVVWAAGGVEIAREATIVRVAAEARDASFQVVAAFADEDVADILRPGAFVEARFADRVFEEAIALPVDALYDGGVFAIDADSRLRRVEVEILTFVEGGALVRARDPADLPPGTPILASRLSAPAAGQLVEIRP